VDPDWGGAFWKTIAYPRGRCIRLNGHSWAQRQCERLGIGYTCRDHGFADCENPALLQRICDRLGSSAVKGFLWRWHKRVRPLGFPLSFAPDRRWRHVLDN
jgi:hypothetical protein